MLQYKKINCYTFDKNFGKMKKNLPNTLTLLNLASGFAALMFLSTGKIHISVYLVLVAAVFDFLDGFAARMLQAWSELGKQLDSLADAVSFGVVPAMILFHETLLATGRSFPAEFPAVIYQFMPLLIIVAAVYRLGKFNLAGDTSGSFRGLPTPAMALFFISFPQVRESGYFSGVVGFLNHPSALAVMALVFAWLMVSDLPMFSLKFRSMDFRKYGTIYLFLMISLLLLVLFSLKGLFLIVILYIFMAVILWVVPGKSKKETESS